MKKWLFNPFIYLAGTRALVIGLNMMVITAVVGYYSRTHFDGVIDVHSTAFISTLPVHLLEQIIDWGIPTAILYFMGRIFSVSSVRLADVAGTIALARWVMIIPAILGFGIHAPATIPQTLNEIMQMITPAMIMIGVLTILIVIWMVGLLYNAYTISCNLKGSKAIITFTIGLILAETASFFIMHYYLKPLE